MKANRMTFIKGQQTTITDPTNKRISSHHIVADFEMMQEYSFADRHKLIMTTGLAENRLKCYLLAKLNRDIDNLLDECSWMKRGKVS